MQSAAIRRAIVGVAIALLPVVGGGVAADNQGDLERRVQRLENILDGDQLVELLDRINELERQVRELRGTVEEQNHRLSQLQERQRNLYADIDQRVRTLELDQDRAVAAPETVEQAVADPASEAEGSEREDYQEAFNTLRDGRYEAAAEAFTAFLEQHPDSDYAANAQYWLGEAHYVNRDFETAIDAFEQVLAEYPDSAKAPDARLKIGYTQYEMEDYEAARETLNEVREAYADSAVGRLAEERLVRMREEGH